MSDIVDLIPVPPYSALQPYHWQYDNIPITALTARDEALNDAINVANNILVQAAGSAGTLAARLAQSLNDDGSLKVDEIDEALHNIGAHEDGTYDGISYVRFMLTERNKLELIADEATDVSVSVETPSTVILFEEGQIALEASDSITWSVTSPNIVKANMAFPTEAAHRHYYDVEPEPASMSPDYINYETGLPNPYVEGSLRVYINGVRLSSEASVYVPGALPTDDWTLNKFTPDEDGESFALDEAITEDDIIRIDFDISLT